MGMRAIIEEYRAQGITTFPINPTTGVPVTKWSNAKADYRWEEKSRYRDCLVGMRTGDVVTIIDVDVPKDAEGKPLSNALIQVEEDVEWARSFFGSTPLESRTKSGGYHLWYRANPENVNEGAYTDVVEPDDYILHGQIDIRGRKAIAKVPDSTGYQFIAGTLDAVPELPTLPMWARKRTVVERNGPSKALSPLAPSLIPIGARNSTLFAMACQIGREATSYESLLDALLTINVTATEQPLSDAEVERIAGSVWTYKSEGRLWNERMVSVAQSTKEKLIQSPYAYLLYSDLIDRHGRGKDFQCGNAGSKRYGWTPRRFAGTLKELEDAGLIAITHPPNRKVNGEWVGSPRRVRLL